MNPNALQALLALTIALPSLLERGVAALEQIASNGGGTPANVLPLTQPTGDVNGGSEEETPTPKGRKGKAKDTAPAGPTPAEIIAKIQGLVQPVVEADPSKGSTFAKIVQKHGGTRFTDIPEANLSATLADVEAFVETTTKSGGLF